MSTTLHVEWPANPASEFVTSYDVYESVNAGPFNFKTNTPGASLDILNPSPGTYAWKIRAKNFVGTSGDSPVIQGPTVPSNPGQGTVTVITA